jgi:hypothetical protein
MQEIAPIAIVDNQGDIRVNFGVFAGREATPAEIEELARALLDEVGAVTIVAEQRFIVDREMEASIHQIRVLGRGADTAALLRLAERWAESCIAERHLEITDS